MRAISVRAADAVLSSSPEVKPVSDLFTLPQQQLKDVDAALARRAVAVEALGVRQQDPPRSRRLQIVDDQVDQTTGTVGMKAEFPNANLVLWRGSSSMPECSVISRVRWW